MKKNKTVIIAEAGVNHNGNIQKAFQLIEAAAQSGVDYVKFQTFQPESVVSRTAKKAKYQLENTGDKEESQLEMLKKLRLSEKDHKSIIQHCNKNKVRFFSTAFDLQSLQFLKDLGLEQVKIPSGEITNLPYLRLAAKLFDSAIISTGMASMPEIKSAVRVFKKAAFAKEDLTILHCNTEYPTPYEDVNLKAMLKIREETGSNVGYSDHTMGIEVPIAAVTLGAKVIEKHFTLKRSMKGPDHNASLEPNELKQMVKAIRNTEKAISGSGIKEPSPSEIKNKFIARKSIVASKYIKVGERFTENNITTKRPERGISPMDWDKIIGKKAKREFQEDECIEI